MVNIMNSIQNSRKEIFSNWKSEWLFYAVIFSLYVGQGVSYGKICLFHFTLPVYIVKECSRSVDWKSFFSMEVFPIHVLYFWVLSDSFFHPVNWNYIYFYLLSYMIFCSLWMKRSYIIEKYKSILFFLFMLVSIDCFVGILESFTVFRYPISIYSKYNNLFGRNYLNYSGNFYDLSSPAGFHWNPNNYSFVLLLFIPFTHLITNHWIKNSLRILTLLLINAAGARMGFFAATLIIIILTFFEWKRIHWLQIFPVLLMSYILTNGFYFFPSGVRKIEEVALIKNETINANASNKGHNIIQTEYQGSESIRLGLLYSGFRFIHQSPIIGHGAGGFTRKLEEQYNESKDTSKVYVTSGHNFFQELLVDFGLILLLPLLWILWEMVRRVKNKERSDVLIMSTLSISFIAGSVMVSSLVYFLPFYLILFILYIILTSEKGSLTLTNKSPRE